MTQRLVRHPLGKWLVLAGVLVALGVPSLPAQADLVQSAGAGKGQIDWTSGTITVTGSGAPPERGSVAQRRLLAQRAAVADGYRQLAEIINGVHVDSETVVRDMVTESDTIRTKVSALVKGARPGAPRYLSDGAVEVDVTSRLYGQAGLSGITAPATVFADDGTETDSHRPRTLQLASASLLPHGFANLFELAAAARPVPKKRQGLSRKPLPPQTKIVPAAVKAGYTGVIINCRGFGAQPAMSPTIMDSAGGEIYVGRKPMPDSFIDFVINEGIVSYASSLDEATQLQRAGKRPLVVTATGVSGSFKADAVLDGEAAKQLLGAESDAKLLSDAKVVFVL